MIAPSTPAIMQHGDLPDDNTFQTVPNWSVGIYLYYDADSAIEAARLLAAEGRRPVRIWIRLTAGSQRTPWRTVRPLEWIQPKPETVPRVAKPAQPKQESLTLNMWDQIPAPEQETLLKLVAAMRLVGAGSLGDLIQLTLTAERLREQGS